VRSWREVEGTRDLQDRERSGVIEEIFGEESCQLEREDSGHSQTCRDQVKVILISHSLGTLVGLNPPKWVSLACHFGPIDAVVGKLRSVHWDLHPG